MYITIKMLEDFEKYCAEALEVDSVTVSLIENSKDNALLAISVPNTNKIYELSLSFTGHYPSPEMREQERSNTQARWKTRINEFTVASPMFSCGETLFFNSFIGDPWNKAPLRIYEALKTLVMCSNRLESLS